MNFAPFGVRDVKPGGSLKRQAGLEISLNLNCAARGVGISHGIYRQRRISLRVPRIGIISKPLTPIGVR